MEDYKEQWREVMFELRFVERWDESMNVLYNKPRLFHGVFFSGWSWYSSSYSIDQVVEWRTQERNEQP